MAQLKSGSTVGGTAISLVGHPHTISAISDATTVGQNIAKLTNPGAITFLRLNAANTADALSAADFRTAIGVVSFPEAPADSKYYARYNSTWAEVVAGTYDRATSVLADANVFSDIVVTNGVVTSISTRALTLANLGYTGATNANYYVHPTTDGSLHVPATSTTNSGKALLAGATAGAISWQTLIASNISDFDTEVSNNTSVAANTSKVSFPEAPSDSKYYARYNAGWAEVVAGTYDRATSALTGANVFSDIVVADGIVTTISTRALALGDANQNAFSNIAVSGQTTVAADTTTDTLTLVAGANVTITTDAGAADSVTIASAHPSITAATSSDNSGRTYIQDITLDTNGHVTGLATATETVTDTNTTYSISAVDSGTSALLRLTAGGSGSGTDDITLTPGTAITIEPVSDVITIAHADTSTITGQQGTVGVSSVTVDGLGHVTAVGTATYLTSETSHATVVTATSAFGTDNILIKSDSTGRGTQATGISIADTTNNISGAGTYNGVDISTLTSNAGTVTSVTADGTALTSSGGATPQITHATTAGYKHIPTGGATSQILRYSASGTAVWSDETAGSTKTVSYEDRYTMPSAGSTATIDITQFDYTDDTLVVFWNSTKITAGLEYTLTNNTTITKISGTWESGDIFDFLCLKTVSTTPVTADAVTYENLSANGDVGTAAGQVAIGNHTHAGTYEPADGTILKDADIGVTVQAYNASYVTGPASAVDNTLPRYNSTTGKIIQGSGVSIDDSNNITGIVGLTASGTVTADGLTLGDGDYIKLGADNDLQLLHTGTYNRILSASTLYFYNGAGTEILASFAPDGACQLSYDNVTRLATSATGVTVTGNISATNLSGTNTGDNAGVTGVTGTAPVVSSGGNTPAISMAAATASVNGYMTSTFATKLNGIETSADVTDAVNVGSSIYGATAKTTLADADTMALTDSAASNVLKKITWANIKATLKTYFDSLTTTFTNKRITPRSGSTTSTATLTFASDSYDIYALTAQAAALSIANPSGTPTNGQKIMIRIYSAGAYAITWSGTYWRAIGVTLPTTTVAAKTIYVGAIWNSSDTKWDVLAVGTQA